MMSPLSSRLGGHVSLVSTRAVRGFTIVELMVAIVMSMFLVAGIFGIVVSLRQTSRVQDNLTQLHDSERFMLTVFNTSVHQAGYFTNPVVNTAAAALPVSASANPDDTTFIAEQFISGSDGAGTASDTINLRFQSASGDGLTNCQGDTNATALPIVWTSSFSINTDRQLVCAVSTNGGVAGTPTVLADNIANMSILYGVDTDEDGTVDRYMNATDVTAAAFWARIYTVQLSVTFRDAVSAGPAKDMPFPIFHTISLMNRP
ncbi:MAG: PilW family protein [Pseudomonadota bacterium]